MCTGIALAWSEVPLALIERHNLERRSHERGGEREIHFLYHDRDPCLPIWHEGQLRIVRWGNSRRLSPSLPRTGWTWQSTVEAGGWKHCAAVPVDIPAMMGLEKGIWYRIRQGIRGLLVADGRGEEAVYVICEPASHYYQTMTRSQRMPVLIEQRI